MMNDTHVVDKNGQRVQRANGILLDGDHLVVKMRVMDGVPRPGLFMTDTAQPPTREQLQQMRDTRNAALSNAWRQPVGRDASPPIAQSRDEALALRDQSLRDAWRG
ncbi:hypothetical protein [Bradyrhizobium arachidis]|uniref:hypothetical protein n=1 Tax=Bradyrhizobium arachidis TaxID=858423 RepID=UPI0021628FE8|nr:hypothetical protein [Bradyrhizobium arachidis]UVO28342.1 hypothetical protein KUF59_38770 [Bradyrhizobium arachidis]